MKYQLAIFCSLLLCSTSYAQEKIEHSKRYYVSEDTTIYWNKKLPMYLFLSDTPDGESSVRMNSKNQAAYTNPMYLDTEGVNYIRSRWAVNPSTGRAIEPKKEVMFEVYRDGLPPASKYVFSDCPHVIVGGEEYFGKGLSMQIKSIDYGSGVDQSMLSVNSEEYQIFYPESTLVMDLEGNYELAMYSVDLVGNDEEVNKRKFVVDTSSPTTQLVIEGEQKDNFLSPGTLLNLLATDQLSGVANTHYAIDHFEKKIFSKSIRLNQLTEGEHMLTYYSSDKVANEEVSNKYNFVLDKSAPVTNLVLTGDQYLKSGEQYISERTELSLEAKDNLSGVQDIYFELDGQKREVFTNKFVVPAKDGLHRLVHYATDQVGNGYLNSNNIKDRNESKLIMDTNSPDLEWRVVGQSIFTRDTMFITSETSIELFSLDGGAGVKDLNYVLDSEDMISYEVPFTIKQEGLHIIKYNSHDQVNNFSEEQFVVVVDNTSPASEGRFSMDPIGNISLDKLEENLNVYTSGVVLYLGATDQIVDTKEIYYTLNGSVETKYDSPIRLTEEGVNELKFRAEDQLGNLSELTKIKCFVQ